MRSRLCPSTLRASGGLPRRGAPVQTLTQPARFNGRVGLRCINDSQPPSFAFCGVITADSLPLSAPVPAFLLMHADKPLLDIFTHLSADNVRVLQMKELASASTAPPSGRERACSVESVSAALFLGQGRPLHVCTAQDGLSDRLVSFARDARQSSSGLSYGSEFLAPASVLAGAFLLMLIGGAVYTLAADYPATIGLSVNTISSVAIIFINKILYQRGFKYGARGFRTKRHGRKIQKRARAGRCSCLFALLRFSHRSSVLLIVLSVCPFAPSACPRVRAVVTLGGIHFLATSSVRLCARKQTTKDGDVSLKGARASERAASVRCAARTQRGAPLKPPFLSPLSPPLPPSCFFCGHPTRHLSHYPQSLSWCFPCPPDKVIFTVLNTGALSFSNLSLFFNSVGFYQVRSIHAHSCTHTHAILCTYTYIHAASRSIDRFVSICSEF